eukprot:COSAG02_NODE_1949_length_10291_cov_176.843505_2_plen_176_part_00
MRLFSLPGECPSVRGQNLARRRPDKSRPVAGRKSEMLPHTHAVAGGRIPLVYVEPAGSDGGGSGAPRHLCIWQPGFSGAKEAVLPRLRELADAGFVALCFDAPDHGERLVDKDAAALGKRVRSNLRKYFWEILRDHAREFSIVIDWAIDALGMSRWPWLSVGTQLAGMLPLQQLA